MLGQARERCQRIPKVAATFETRPISLAANRSEANMPGGGVAYFPSSFRRFFRNRSNPWRRRQMIPSEPFPIPATRIWATRIWATRNVRPEAMSLHTHSPRNRPNGLNRLNRPTRSPRWTRSNRWRSVGRPRREPLRFLEPSPRRPSFAGSVPRPTSLATAWKTLSCWMSWDEGDSAASFSLDKSPSAAWSHSKSLEIWGLVRDELSLTCNMKTSSRSTPNRSILNRAIDCSACSTWPVPRCKS